MNTCNENIKMFTKHRSKRSADLPRIAENKLHQVDPNGYSLSQRKLAAMCNA